MDRSRMPIVAIVVLGLILGAVYIINFSEVETPVENTTEEIILEPVNVFPPDDGVIKIGCIVPTTSSLEDYVPLFSEMVEPDINEYIASLGYNFTIEYVIKSADGQTDIHLETVQEFKENGTDLVICSSWSSHTQGSLKFVNENDMIMVSPKATSPLLAIKDDRLFRVCPMEHNVVNPLVEIFDSWGIDGVIILQRNDTWAKRIYEKFENGWLDRDKDIIGKVSYSVELTEFSDITEELEGVIAENAEKYGYEHISILTLSFDELWGILYNISEYPEMQKVIWMSIETPSRCCFWYGIGDTILQMKTGFFSINNSPVPVGQNWESFKTRFEEHEKHAYYTIGSYYDAAWILALSVIETESTNATLIADILPEIAANYHGVTGQCVLDEYGDRLQGSYDIRGVYETEDGFSVQNYGFYDGENETMIWFDDLLTENGYNRPR